MLARLAWLVCFAAAFALGVAPLRAADAWEPVAAEDLAATASRAGADADSEYLFWRCSIEDESQDVLFKNHVRAKIYTARGVENAGKLHFDRATNSRLSRLSARIVKPDGTSIELKKSDFLETEVMKLGSYKVRRTSFAFPGLAPGDVVEYRWRLTTELGNPVGHYFCQHSVPVREYTLEVAANYAGIQASWFNVKEVETVKTGGGSKLKIIARNLPAFVEEPQMSPELDSRGWIRLSYAGDVSEPVKQWQNFSKASAELFVKMTKPNDAIRKKAAELAAGATDPEEVLRRFDEFCRTKIINVAWSDAPEAREERERKRNRDLQDARATLQRGRGWPIEIDYLFASLAIAAGRDVRQVFNAPTYHILNTRIPQGWTFMDDTRIAVRDDTRWKFRSPGDPFVPFGMCAASAENAQAVILDAKAPLFAELPASRASASGVNRKARLTLDVDGALRGTVEVTYTGHEATERRLGTWGESQEKTDQDLIDAVTARIPGIEISAIQWENLRPQTGPVVLRYQINVPGYAESAGQRLVLVPGYFGRGRTPLFTAPDRKERMMWSHAWTELDDVEIALPAELEIEQATLPPNVPDSGGFLTTKYEIAFAKRRHTVIYKREFAFTGVHGFLFEPKAYAGIKSLFEALNRSDLHSIVLRPKAAAAPAPAVVPPTATTPAGDPPANTASKDPS